MSLSFVAAAFLPFNELVGPPCALEIKVTSLRWKNRRSSLIFLHTRPGEEPPRAWWWSSFGCEASDRPSGSLGFLLSWPQPSFLRPLPRPCCDLSRPIHQRPPPIFEQHGAHWAQGRFIFLCRDRKLVFDVSHLTSCKFSAKTQRRICPPPSSHTHTHTPRLISL